MEQQPLHKFGPFRLDTSRRVLYRNGDVIHLAPKAIEILALLVERPKEVFSKQELIDAVWPDTYVEESNLAHNIALLRKTLEDGGGKRSWIETIPKRGYRFAGEVERLQLAPEHSPPISTPEPRAPSVVSLGTEVGARPRSKRSFVRLAPAMLMVTVLVTGILWTTTRNRSRDAGLAPLQLHGSLSADPAASDLYIRGKSLTTRRIRSENQEAIRLLEHAVAKDTAFAAAYAVLAVAYIERFFTFAPEEQPELLPRTRAVIERAISLDPNSADAYFARGRLLWSPVNGFAHEKAVQDFRRAIALNPRSVQAHWWLGAVYGHIGLFEEGFREAKLAADLSPLGALPPNHLVEPLMWQGKYEQALQFLLSNPNEGDTSLIGSNIAWTLYQLGKTKDASATAERYLKDSPEDMGGALQGLQALFLAADRQDPKAEEKIREAARKQGTGQFHHTAYFLACTYARLNRPDRVVQWLQHAAENGFPCYPLFKRDPSLDPVRRDPSFLEFMEKLEKQSEYWQRLL